MSLPPLTVRLPIDSLSVDLRYHQRLPASFQRGREYRPLPAHIPLTLFVNYIDGRYSIIDGTVRWGMMYERGYTHVPCRVFRLEFTDEVQMFMDLNTGANR